MDVVVIVKECTDYVDTWSPAACFYMTFLYFKMGGTKNKQKTNKQMISCQNLSNVASFVVLLCISVLSTEFAAFGFCC